MDSFSANVESELIDLGPIPLKVLWALDDVVLQRALRHAVEQIGYARITEAHGGERID